MARRDARLAAIRADHEALREALDDVVPRRRREGLLADVETRHVAAGDVDQRHRRVRVARVAHHESGIADVLHAQIAPIQLFHLAGGDLQRNGHVREAHADQRESGFLRLDRGRALAVKARIHEQELPHRRRALRDDAVLAAVDVDVARLVADVFHGRTRGAHLEVHVRERAVLRDVEAHRDRRGIPVLHLEVDVAHAAEERELRGVDDRRSGVGPVVREMDQVAAGAFLEARRVAREHEDGSRRSVAEQANALPDVHGLAQAIASRGDQHDAGAGRLLHAIDGPLQRVRIVAHAVRVRAERLASEVHRARIVRPDRVDRLGPGGTRPEHESGEQGGQRFHGVRDPGVDVAAGKTREDRRAVSCHNER